ncbi:GGDEF domain-containing protein [Dactylosporangium vinaceum]|uniref:Diguanylate cyclase domain-containing protein n=1 Tax=Dactylosporangium vinaceum TaxID=53362 RepID=A0ABV5M2M2_9ACTN|nr:GGDEF domain-containing protein [Dactylosporangium vinaceum]UAB96296.1 GGDEF domain-containing protein [Dactylosporangium vinaceum]
MSTLAALSAAAAAGVLAGLLLAAVPLWRLLRALRTARHQAHHDDTTGLPNRRAFLAAVDDVQRGGQAFGLVLLDLDKFKQVNDVHGHDAGNDLLTAVGHRLAGQPDPVRLAARLSGDEFALLVRGDADATYRAAQLAATVIAATPIALQKGVTVAVSASVGYTTNRLGVSTRDLLGEADTAMYRAKRGARPVYRYEPVTEATEPHGRCRDRR